MTNREPPIQLEQRPWERWMLRVLMSPLFYVAIVLSTLLLPKWTDDDKPWATVTVTVAVSHP